MEVLFQFEKLTNIYREILNDFIIYFNLKTIIITILKENYGLFNKQIGFSYQCHPIFWRCV